MRTDQADRIDDLRTMLDAGGITPEEFQQRSFAILTEPADDPVDVGTPADDNPPPTPLHVWNGDTWVLPAQHELAMLSEIEQAEEIEPEVEESLAETRTTIEARLLEQEALAAEAGE